MLRLACLVMVVCAACGDDPPQGAPDAAATPDAAPPEGQGAEPRGDIVINEVASSGPDWIELTNRGAAPVDISGWFLTDAIDRPDHFYVFPAGSVIAPGAYLVVAADNGVTGAPFQLSRADGVHVITADGLVADALLYLDPDDGRTLAREPDHEGLFFPAASSPGAVNP